MFLATGLLAALLHARATGEGQVVDAAMTEGAAYLGSMTRTFVANGGWIDEREANLLDGGAPNYRCYATADGKWVAVGALEPQFWAALVTALGLDPASTPGPYVPDRAGRLPHAAGRHLPHPHPGRVGRALRAAGRLRGARC